MALITDATSSWSNAVALSNKEIWQVREGEVLFSTRTTPAGTEGLFIPKNYMIEFSAGVSVKYRLAPGCTSAEIARESVSSS